MPFPLLFAKELNLHRTQTPVNVCNKYSNHGAENIVKKSEHVCRVFVHDNCVPKTVNRTINRCIYTALQ